MLICTSIQCAAIYGADIGRNKSRNQKSKKPRCCAAFEGLTKLERAKGFEPSTPTLARLCSTPELHPLAPVCWLGLRYMSKSQVICNRENSKSVIFLKALRQNSNLVLRMCQLRGNTIRKAKSRAVARLLKT